MTSDGGDKQWTVLELLNWTADYFKGKGIENPRLNAEVLLSKVLGLERIMLYARFEQPVAAAEREAFRQMVRRRAARQPLQYLVGRCEFHGREFEVTPAVMVPRQETELVVAKCLEKMPNGRGEPWAADIGTGSGAIAVTLAAERPPLRLVATDSSEQALAVAARNAARHGVQDRIRFAKGDLAGPVPGHLPAGREGVDFMVCNPPYVPTAQIDRLQPEVRDYEPRAALDGGSDGLDVVRRLLPQAAHLLMPEAWLVLELGEGQAEVVRQMLGQDAAFATESVETAKDASGCERVLCVRKSGR